MNPFQQLAAQVCDFIRDHPGLTEPEIRGRLGLGHNKSHNVMAFLAHRKLIWGAERKLFHASYRVERKAAPPPEPLCLSVAMIAGRKASR